MLPVLFRFLHPAWLVLIAGLVFPLPLVAAPLPNVVYIMADDLGIGDVECFGGDRCAIDTPHMDALARAGMQFTDAHAPASVCVPTRVAIMTGRYAWRFKRPRPSGPWGFLNPQIPVGHFTLATLLERMGYQAGYVGKWHLGTLMQTHDGKNQGEKNVDYTKPLKIGPVQYGFPDSFILPGSLDMYPYAFVRNGEWVGEVTAQKGWSAFNRVGPAAEDFEDTKVIDSFASEAEQFVARQAGRKKPFFLYVALTSPHTPTSPSKPFQGKSKLGLYGDFVMETDHCVGRVLAALKKHGFDSNTLVIVTSDHGAAPYAGRIAKATPGQLIELEKDGHYSSGIYRGYKFSAWEGGFRIPLIARWPAVVPPGTRCDQLVGLNDLVATLADIGGARLAVDEAPDSISYLPLLKNPNVAGPRKTMVMRSVLSYAIRSGDWKLIVGPGSGAKGVFGNLPQQEESWKKAVARFGRQPKLSDLRRPPFVQLYNLKDDPGERSDLARQQPQRVAALIALLDQQVTAGRSRPGPNLENDVPRINYHARVPGFVLQKPSP